MNFEISEQTLRIYAQEMIMWGQSKRLEPAELAIVLGMVSDQLKDMLGMTKIETKEVQK